MKREKDRIIISIIIIIVLIVAFVGIVCFISNTDIGKNINDTDKEKNFTIVLDSGHGGNDTGYIGVIEGTHESHINKEITKRIKKYLKGRGMTVIMADDYDESELPSSDRTISKIKTIQDADEDAVISVHQSFSEDPEKKGMIVSYKADSEESLALAKNIKIKVKSIAGIGVELQETSSGDYAMYADGKPAVTVYCGYLSNPAEETLLKKDKYRIMLVKGIAEGIISYFGGNDS